MKNKLHKPLIGIVVLSLVILAYFVLYQKPATILDQGRTPEDKKDEVLIDNIGTTNNQTETGSNQNIVTLRDSAWAVFEAYLNAAKLHNVSLVKTLSYQQSAVCADSTKQKECFGLMDNLYLVGSGLKKDDYKNIWSDEKQIILFTDSVGTKSEDIYGYKKGFIFLTRDTDGSIKMLALDPEQGWGVKKESYMTDEQVEDKLAVFIRDTDQDGLTDRTEQCPTSSSDLAVNCTKTDPTKRDTDGDGWWDGVEFYFNKK